jgi:hypothetical protein
VFSTRQGWREGEERREKEVRKGAFLNYGASRRFLVSLLPSFFPFDFLRGDALFCGGILD